MKYTNLIWYNYNFEEKLGRSATWKTKRRWGNNTKMDFKETVECVDLIHLSQYGTSGMFL
jgi:hypothetical protein